MIAAVRYGRVPDVDKIRQCPRCEGTTKDRSTDFTQPCPLCPDSPGVHPIGWGYRVPDGMVVGVGDIVLTPPTPYSGGRNMLATVVDVAERARGGFLRKTLVEVVERVAPDA